MYVIHQLTHTHLRDWLCYILKQLLHTVASGLQPPPILSHTSNSTTPTNLSTAGKLKLPHTLGSSTQWSLFKMLSSSNPFRLCSEHKVNRGRSRSVVLVWLCIGGFSCYKTAKEVSEQSATSVQREVVIVHKACQLGRYFRRHACKQNKEQQKLASITYINHY